MVVLAVAEHAGRFALNRRGVASRVVDSPAGPVHFYDARGRGPLPTLVMLHGYGASATPYGLLLPRLRREVRRVIVPDSPGHGFSAAPEGFTPEVLYAGLAHVLDRELDEPAVLCGNSLGGALALRYAIDRPARVRGVVATSPAGARMDPDEEAALRAVFRMASARDGRAFLEKLYHRMPWYAGLFARELPAVFARRHLRELLESASSAHFFTAEHLRALAVPVLVLWGRSDRILPRSSLEFFRAHLPPHGVVEELDAVGHCPHMDAPDALVERLTRFAASLR